MGRGFEPLRGHLEEQLSTLYVSNCSFLYTAEMEVSQIVAIYYNKIVLNGHINDIFKITDVGSNGMYVIYACENQSNSKCVLSVNKLIKQVMIARCNTDITYIFS